MSHHPIYSLCEVSTCRHDCNNTSGKNTALKPLRFGSNNYNPRVISPIPMRPIRPAQPPPPNAVLQIRDSDIICGRGSGASGHKGNVVFRKVIAQVQHYYHYANAVEKADLSRRIVNMLLAGGSRFLRRVERPNDPLLLDQPWEELDAKAAREKVCQALREKRAAFEEPVPRDSSIWLFGVLQVSNANHPTSNASADTIPTSSPSSNIPHNNTSTTSTSSSPDFVIGPNDVLLGRGGVTNCWSGNKQFRTLVHDHQLKYLGAPKRQKGVIARQIVDLIHSRGGRFLEDAKGKWVCAEDKAIEKTKQALREKGPEMKRIYRAAVNLVKTAHSSNFE